ncbi:Uncharacterized protein dnm_025370 [Desulfonema magnum]|uniref:Uncharacterized protein n=1 Tax=Desulfonema magnum TaxID=45655 RepID=A0A975BJH6_9BACT|nr:Uncharacterized protein dnm_025370 [Desulfonema magnum]
MLQIRKISLLCPLRGVTNLKSGVVPRSGGLFFRDNLLILQSPPERGTTNFFG